MVPIVLIRAPLRLSGIVHPLSAGVQVRLRQDTVWASHFIDIKHLQSWHGYCYLLGKGLSRTPREPQ